VGLWLLLLLLRLLFNVLHIHAVADDLRQIPTNKH